MFARYALVFGRGAQRHALLLQSQSAGLNTCVETPEMLLVAETDTPVLYDERTIFVGQLFSARNERVDAPPAGLGHAFSAASLRQALDGHWGNYAVFFANHDGFGAYREPSGSVSVYGIGGANAAIYVSDAEIALELGLLGRAVPDLRFPVHWLQFPFLRTRRTGLQNVTELLPGVLALKKHSHSWAEMAVWHPREFVTRENAIADPAEAAARLRETALAVVPAQLDARDNPVLRLSGGLDSSIIAACFSQAQLSFSSVNFATSSRDGDERSYAREVAAASRSCLHEIAEPQQVGLGTVARASFRPRINPLLLPFEEAIQSLASDVGASMLVDGAGGDNLFCAISSAAPVIDALLNSGLADAAASAGNIAERANCTFSEVLFAAARRFLKPRAAWNEDLSFLSSRAVLGVPELHPWLTQLHTIPGKREHVEALVHIHHFLDRGMTSTRLLHPLLCQPLLELCLRVPTWLWVRDGRDRTVARTAFEGLVPASILARRTKGSLQSMFYRWFSELRGQMLELLVSGELCSAGIIDNRSIDAALTGNGWEREEVQLRVTEMVALELWMRSQRNLAS